MRRVIDRIANEPAIIVAFLLAAANVGFGVDIDLSEVAELRGQIVETVTLILGGGLVRQAAWGPKTVDRIMDAESVISAAEDDG